MKKLLLLQGFRILCFQRKNVEPCFYFHLLLQMQGLLCYSIKSNILNYLSYIIGLRKMVYINLVLCLFGFCRVDFLDGKSLSAISPAFVDSIIPIATPEPTLTHVALRVTALFFRDRRRKIESAQYLAFTVLIVLTEIVNQPSCDMCGWRSNISLANSKIV